MKPFAKRFYKSDAWKRCRAAYFNSKHGLCEKCGKPGKIVHHLTELTPENISDPVIALSWDNLQLLCQVCHNRVDVPAATAEGLRFDERGYVVREDGFSG